MNRRKMYIKDVENMTGATLTVDVYDQDTHTTNTITISNIANILTNIIARKYNYRYFYYTGSQPNITPTTAFLGVWNEYKTFKQDSINAVFNALVYSKYNPTENVFESRTTLNEYGDQTTTSDIGKIKNETINGARTLTAKSYETSFENANENGYSPTSKGVNESTQATDSTTSEQLREGENTLTRGNDKTTETRHGNVGTVDSMTLILKETDGRHLSFANWIVDDFIAEYTYYSSYDDDYEDDYEESASGGGSSSGGGSVDDSRVTALENSVNTLNSKVNTLESTVNNLDIPDYSAQIENINEDIDNLGDRVTALEGASGGGGSIDSEEFEALDARVATLENTVEEHDTTIDTLILDQLSLESRVDTLESASGGGSCSGGLTLKTYEYVGNDAAERAIPKSLGINAILTVSATNINVDYATLHTVIIPDATTIADILYKSGGNIGSVTFQIKYDDNNIIFYGGADSGARLNYNGGHYTIYYI